MAPEETSPQAPQEDGRPQEPASGSPQAQALEQTQRTRASTGLIEQLAARGYGVVDGFVDADLLRRLRERCLELHAAGALRPARIGRGANERHVPEVRGDFIAWLSEPERDAEQELLARLEKLRAALNRELMAGLEDFQGHFALYPPGAAYARHFDRLVGSDVRAISAALYLNDDWSPDDGGTLRMHVGGGAVQEVLPVGGRLVVFQSDRFEHEVLPARRERMSFTGWYRRRPLEGFV